MSLSAAQQAFLAAAIDAAEVSQKQYGVPASITVAQAILESGWGSSGLAVQAKNYFGIKAVQGQDYVDFRTTEYVHGVPEHVMAEFARYASMADSFTAHAKLLATLPRYAPAMKVSGDPAAFAAAINACGYSTNVGYPAELMALVHGHNLNTYDTALPAAA